MRQKGTLIEEGVSALSTFFATDTLIYTLLRTKKWIQESRDKYKDTYPCANTASIMGCQRHIRGRKQTRYRRQNIEVKMRAYGRDSRQSRNNLKHIDGF